MKDIVLIDGGLHCELLNVGFEFKANTRLWTGSSLVQDPDKLKQAHKKYFPGFLNNLFKANVF